MKYDITKPSAPTMPTLGKRTECIQLLLSQTSKDMHDPLVPMLFPILGAHISGTEFQYPDLYDRLIALGFTKSGIIFSRAQVSKIFTAMPPPIIPPPLKRKNLPLSRTTAHHRSHRQQLFVLLHPQTQNNPPSPKSTKSKKHPNHLSIHYSQFFPQLPLPKC